MKEISISKNQLIQNLQDPSQEEREILFKKACEVTKQFVGEKVYFRGLLEFSNRCTKDCFYCGLRKSNKNLKRFCLSQEEILQIAHWVEEKGYGSIMLQSGEVSTPARIDFILKVVKTIKEKTHLGISLSLGELPKEIYQKLFEAGAHRYLLRIETSNPVLYSKFHPQSHSFKHRMQRLQDLKEIGYQVGTGVMIGLPFQTAEDLVDDLLFFKEFDIDMIGMGPYIPHSATPLAKASTVYSLEERFFLSLKMIALARILLKDINIAAPTALQAIHPQGRELALEAGANVVMPLVTPPAYRKDYLLYEGKPCVNERPEVCMSCLGCRLGKINREIGWKEWGDAPHYFKRR